MRKFLILVPVLFFGLKPYQQPIDNKQPTDSLTPFQRDTLVLSVLNLNTQIQANVSQQLDQRKNQLQNEKYRLLNEIKKIKQRKKEQNLRYRKEKRELEQLIKDLNKYENRGL